MVKLKFIASVWMIADIVITLCCHIASLLRQQTFMAKILRLKCSQLISAWGLGTDKNDKNESEEVGGGEEVLRDMIKETRGGSNGSLFCKKIPKHGVGL